MNARFFYCFCLMCAAVFLPPAEIAEARPQATNQSLAATNGVVDPRLAGLAAQWQRASLPDLLKAAEAGNAQAQYAYWIRESTRVRSEGDILSQRKSDGFYRLKPEEQGKLAEEEQKQKGKWEAASEAELQEAAKSGDLVALTYLAIRKQNQAAEAARKAFVWLEKSAEQGFSTAELEAATYYLRLAGWNIIAINQEKGLELLRRSAEHGLAGAQYQLGTVYRDGQWVPPNFAEAIEYFRAAADQGGPRSQYALARLYENGNGTPRNPEDSPFALLLKSAKGNYAPALHAVAERFRTGRGTPMDYMQAIRYYQAEREAVGGVGNYSANIFEVLDENLLPQPALGPDFAGFARVMSAYRKATERADGRAMSQLGDWYQTGRFMPQDKVEACRWYHLAAGQGVAGAAKKRDAIKAGLSAEEIDRALRRQTR